MAKLPNPVDYAVPFFILLIVIEMFWARRRAPEKYEPRDTLVSLSFGLGSTVASLIFGGAIYALMLQVWEFRPVTVPWTWWAWALCFVLDDFLYYVFHRSAHRVRWFWASHVNHHSSQHYNLSTALRQTWTGWLALSFVFKLPLAAIGFPPAMILFCTGVNLIYQFWIHTEAIKRFPRWFEALMNTPSHHRVHHATNPRYLDANYAGVFIIWDRIFGTFVAEVDDEPIRYGIVRQLGTFNLLYAVFHEWIGIARDVWSAPWRHKLSYLWREPGWSHDGSRDTSDTIRARWQERQMADPAE
ncbi:sterol desaturase family protein [Novosphingobium sp.]|uniref:sterol desaturase family protein n=1 Tax=Novosphingobium sp. TaxID=1874826 RepID=UPI0022CC5E08|nr:sterol desaturase family protein [Novosphingobium sp.]MCZ8018820.1 sterol desaturase family protein [Novosphingobium sp.]MCZ8034825.1 sterol desaturase family protein [Novosphingobium sp.]MCZ8052960.1 sterol desaturase family protein [Novosphingobium sp.]MCZ8060718.1 sterol desaturase family protein [Novosphingobium sp.]MCZ8233261.1 sterol desaturase family protein [Novosphingobium sp.]